MKNPKISIIVAMDKNRGIGKNNGLLWHIPEELKRFREITTGHPIIMGRKTYESIGRPLPNRTNIIITRDPTHVRPGLASLEGCIVVDSLEKAIEMANKSNVSNKSNEPEETKEIFVIGGGQIYNQAMESGVVDKLYVTQVSIDPSSQVFDREAQTESAPQDDRGEISSEFKPTVFFPEYASQFTKKVFEKEIEAEGTKDGNPKTFKVKFLELEK